jgi:hypothetical protein
MIDEKLALIVSLNAVPCVAISGKKRRRQGKAGNERFLHIFNYILDVGNHAYESRKEEKEVVASS